MITASRLAGFFAAHAIWCVSDAETMAPMLATTNAAGERQMMRFVSAGDAADSVALIREKLAANDMDATDAALLYDGRITLDDAKVDAILIEIRAYSCPQFQAVFAIPYTPNASGRFRVHRPRIRA